MTPEDAFLLDIARNPEDATVVLIFADWLEDQDEPVADFLRTHSDFDARYDLQELLSREMQSQTWLAFDRTTEQTVLLKCEGESAEHSDPLHRAQTWREARALARLQHPCIPTLLDVGFARGRPYLVHPYLDLITLQEYLQSQGEMDPEDREPELTSRLLILLKLVQAVQHAHSKGILHGKLGPQSVMIGRDRETVHLTEWGKGRLPLTESEEWADSSEETSYISVGPVRSLAPEQIMGDANARTVASDIYSLGVIMFQMLTNEYPHAGLSGINLLMSIAQENPARPSELNSSISRELEAVCLKCLHKDPAGRYTSAQSLAEDLHLYFADELEWPDEPGAIQRILRWCRNLLPGNRP